MSRCCDKDICFDAGATETARFHLNFTTKLKTLLISMQWQPLSTGSSNSNNTAPGTVHPAQDRDTLRWDHSATLSPKHHTQGHFTENVATIEHAAPCYNKF